MTTATITKSQPGTTSGGESAKGYTWKIVAYCAANNIPLTDSKADRLGVRMKRRADKMQAEFDFYEALRILGISSDPTARQAEHRATCQKLECDTCGRTLRPH